MLLLIKETYPLRIMANWQ